MTGSRKTSVKKRGVKCGGRKEMEKRGKVVPIKPTRKVQIKKETLTQVWAGVGDGDDKGKLARERSKCNYSGCDPDVAGQTLKKTPELRQEAKITYFSFSEKGRVKMRLHLKGNAGGKQVSIKNNCSRESNRCLGS